MNDVYYRQCKMHEVRSDERTVVYVAWIPEKFCMVGKTVDIDMTDGAKTYKIISVSAQRKKKDMIHDVHNLKKSLPSIDR